MRIILFAAALGTLTLSSLARAGEATPVVAVFEIVDRGSGLSRQDRISLTDYLASKLGEGGTFQIIPREEIRKRLVEQKTESYKDCFDESCQVELGRELAAQFTVNTTISKVGDQCLLSAALFDLRKATTTRTASARGDCLVDDLIRYLEGMANVLNGQAPPETTPAGPPPPKVLERPGPRTKSPWIALAWSIIPGGGLFYTGHWGWGMIYLFGEGGGLAMVGVGARSGDKILVDVGLGFVVGFEIIGMIHAMIAAAVWKDPDYVEPSGPDRRAAFEPVPVTEPVPASHPAFVFPVFSTRF